jgi:hypothetical protein
MSYPAGVHAIKRGDDYALDVPVVDTVTGDPLDITGTRFWFTAKRSLFDADVDAVIAKDTTTGITIIDGPGGRARIFIDAADTEALTKRSVLRYDVQWEDTDGGIHTVDSGDLVVELDVTRRTT